MKNKPTGNKNYGSIGHLPNSRMGPADHSCHEGMAVIATEKVRTKHDKVIVQEKLDGTNVGVAKVNGSIYAIQRGGYIASSSPFVMHHYFDKWVRRNHSRFDELLNEGERVCGEWLIQAHGTRYNLNHEPFVAFDIMINKTRLVWDEFKNRVNKFDFVTPHVLNIGESISVKDVMASLGTHGFHGSVDPVEGAVWRIETNRLIHPGKGPDRNWVVDFLVKYVRPDKVDGKYLPDISGEEPIWNCDITEYQ